MDATITNFIRALRASDVPVSTAESIDAQRAATLIGYADRRTFKDSLACILAKSPEEESAFDRVFDLYFARARHKEPASGPDRAEPRSASGEPANGGETETLDGLAASGDEARIAIALEQAAAAVGADNIRFSTQGAFLTRKILEHLGVRDLEERLIESLRAQTPEAQLESDRLMAARADMQARARTYVDQRFELFGRGATEEFMEDLLAQKSLAQLDRRDIERMKVVIAKMAKRLATKHSRRRRKRNRGKLDLRRTLRQNARYDNVPFDLSWKQKRKDRPKLIVICDVSASVSQYVRFLLLLLHSLNEVVPEIHAFAFSNRLREVGDLLDDLDFEEAITKILREVGGGSTDYGQALSDFNVQHWNLLDRRATVIVLGDGRSNYGDPRLDLFKEAAARAKRMIWLCPEYPMLWGTGDSALLRYKPHCNTLAHCANAKDLERAVDQVLLAYD